MGVVKKRKQNKPPNFNFVQKWKHNVDTVLTSIHKHKNKRRNQTKLKEKKSLTKLKGSC